jgi:repressor LexA
MSLTDTQRAILAFIAERIEADGFAPSQAEIARAFGFKGVRAAQYHLEALEAAGIVERSPGPRPRHPPAAVAGWPAATAIARQR